jgi:hypothetical protein
MIGRRNFLFGLGFAVAAPAIVPIHNLMRLPPRQIIKPGGFAALSDLIAATGIPHVSLHQNDGGLVGTVKPNARAKEVPSGRSAAWKTSGV